MARRKGIRKKGGGDVKGKGVAKTKNVSRYFVPLIGFVFKFLIFIFGGTPDVRT